MTAGRAPVGAPREGEAALSSVLGAVLLFGLLVSTLVTVQVEYVPVWDHQREARLMDSMAGQLTQLKSDLERQATNRSNAATTVPVTLAPAGGFALFTGSTQSGNLEFKPAAPNTGLAIGPNALTILHQDDVDLFVLDEDWTDIADGDAVGGIDQVDHLRMRLLNPGLLPTEQWVQVTIREAGNAVAGRLIVKNIDKGDEFALRIQTFRGDQMSTPMTERLHTWKKAWSGDNFYIDTLEPGLGLDAVLQTAVRPLSLQWDTSGNVQRAQSSLVYTSQSLGRVGSAGISVPAYTHVADGGRLVASRENQQFPPQTYSLEYGALIVDQPEGSAMLAPPAFNVRASSGQTVVTWTLPELTGPAGEIAGTRAAQVSSSPMGARLSLQAIAPSLTFTLATEHPAVWKAFWDRALGDAGLSPTTSPPHYTVTTTPTSAKLELFGLGAAGANDLSLTYQEANLALSLLPSGG